MKLSCFETQRQRNDQVEKTLQNQGRELAVLTNQVARLNGTVWVNIIQLTLLIELRKTLSVYNWWGFAILYKWLILSLKLNQKYFGLN